jgi:hypothetical protein
MAMMAVAFPILPGKTDAWKRFAAELNGPRKAEFEASRAKAHVREQSFHQVTPMGDLVIVTLSGEDPARSFGEMMHADDAFTHWFVEQVKELHGVDVTAPMVGGPPSTLVIDSGEGGRPR